MHDNSLIKTIKVLLAIVLTGGLIVFVWTVKRYLDRRAEASTFDVEELERKQKKQGQLRIAFGLATIAVLMVAVYYFEVDQYFMTSLLNADQKRAIAAAASSYEGAGYQLGSTGPSTFDCSGFVGTVVTEALGISLPRTSRDMYSVGRDISFNNLDVGDLVFFDTAGNGNISHVGVITERQGDRVFMTNANSYYGKVMKEEMKGYWLETYVGARELTAVTANMTAPATPDPTYTAPTNTDDQYNDDFPPSEPADPRLVVGSETTDNDTTVVVEDDSTTDDTPLFSDVPKSHPNYKAIQYLKENGIINGYNDGSFKPAQTVTRAETLKIALNGSGIGTDAYRTQSSDFSDVPASHSLIQFVNYAKASGIVNGYPDGTYKPDNTITRGEGAKVLIKIQNINPPTPVSAPYNDVPTSLELAKYIAYVQSKNLLDVTGAVYRINDNMTRGDVAEMMYRLLVIKKTNAASYNSLLKI